MADYEEVFRTHWWPAVAALTRALGDPGQAEDAVQEACAAALAQWPAAGLPENPTGWLVTVGRRRALDRLRREAQRAGKERRAVDLRTGTAGMSPAGGGPPPAAGPLAAVGSLATGDSSATEAADEQLALVVMCCHPALALEAQVPLTLRSVCAMSVPEIAAGLLLPEATVAKRLTRARQKIRTTGIPLRLPPTDELPERLAGVRKVVYLVYTEGHTAGAGPSLHGPDLSDAAVHLARRLAVLVPKDAETLGLLALLLLTDARSPGRLDGAGRLVTLEEQDRGGWDPTAIATGMEVLATALDLGEPPGPYLLQAGIAACHTTAPTAEGTDWDRILRLYDRLVLLEPSAVTAANRAVAVAMTAGPAAGVAALDALAGDPAVRFWPHFHIARASLLGRVGRTGEACSAYRAALDLPLGGAVRDHVMRRLAALGGAPGGGR